jgi:DUF4097 and DUF4098 domain-containing protein YvlB
MTRAAGNSIEPYDTGKERGETMRRHLWILCLVASVCAGGRAVAGTPVDQTRSAPAHGVVSIKNITGSIHVTGWSQNQVKVTGTLGEDVEKLAFDSEGDHTRIEVVVPDHMSWQGKKKIDSDLEVSVPQGSDVRVDGVNLEVQVAAVNGELELQSVNGSLVVKGQPSEIKATTVNGTITLQAGARKTHLEAVNGGIEVTGGSGELEASCVNGHIEVREGTFDEAKCSTVSGDLTWSASLGKRASLGLETHSGSILLELPRSTDAEFQVSTFSGKIVNDLGPEAKRSDPYAPGYELQFDLGSASSKIEVSSFSGGVTIRAK